MKKLILYNFYKFIVTEGNNSRLVKKVLEVRPWWIEEQTEDIYNFHFKW